MAQIYSPMEKSVAGGSWRGNLLEDPLAKFNPAVGGVASIMEKSRCPVPKPATPGGLCGRTEYYMQGPCASTSILPLWIPACAAQLHYKIVVSDVGETYNSFHYLDLSALKFSSKPKLSETEVT